MAGRLELDRAHQDARYRFHPATRANRLAHIHLVVVEQAEMELAVGGQAHPVAGSAVRLADRAGETDHTDLPRQGVVARRLWGIARLELHQRAERLLDSPPGLDVRDVALDRKRRAF